MQCAPHPLGPHGFANGHTSTRPHILSPISRAIFVNMAVANMVPFL